MDDDISYSLDDDLGRAEGESFSFAEYDLGHPAFIRRSHRPINSAAPSIGIPGFWVHKGVQDAPRRYWDPVSGRLIDVLDPAYVREYIRKPEAFINEFAEVDDSQSSRGADAIVGNARGVQ